MVSAVCSPPRHHDHRVERDVLRVPLTNGAGRSKMAAVRSGGCLCGAVRYESAGEPLFSLLCHCRDCQHQSGSAYVAAMRVPAAGFRVIKGEPKLYASASDAGNSVTRAFCQECGCPLFIRVSTRRRSSGCGSAVSTTRAGFAPRPTSSSRARNPGTTWIRICPSTRPIRQAELIRRSDPDRPTTKTSPPPV